MAKMDNAWTEKRQQKNINNAYLAFVCALKENPDKFFFSEENGLEVEKSCSDDKVDDGYCSKDSNTSK